MRRLLVGLALIFAFLVGTAWYVLTSPETEVTSGLMEEASDEVFTSDEGQAVAAPTTLSEVQGNQSITDQEATTSVETDSDQETTSTTEDEDGTTATTEAASDNDEADTELNTSQTTTASRAPTTTARSATTGSTTPVTNAPTTTAGPTRPYALPAETGTAFAVADLTNVGSRNQLTYVVDTPGTVINRQNIEGCLVIEANNVTVQNSRITCRSDRTDLVSGIQIPEGVTGTNIVRNTIVCSATGTSVAPCTAGIRGSNFSARFNNISGGVNGILATGPNVTAARNYVHNLRTGTDPWQATGQSFNNGLRSYGGANIVFVGNYLQGSAGSINGVFVQPEDLAQGGNTPTAVVRDNYITGNWLGGIECRSHVNNNFTVNCNIQGNLIAEGLPRSLIHVATEQTTRVVCNRLIGGGFVPNSRIFGASQNNNNCS